MVLRTLRPLRGRERPCIGRWTLPAIIDIAPPGVVWPDPPQESADDRPRGPVSPLTQNRGRVQVTAFPSARHSLPQRIRSLPYPNVHSTGDNSAKRLPISSKRSEVDTERTAPHVAAPWSEPRSIPTVVTSSYRRPKPPRSQRIPSQGCRDLVSPAHGGEGGTRTPEPRVTGLPVMLFPMADGGPPIDPSTGLPD